MPDDGLKALVHNLPHLRIDNFRRENLYTPPPRRIETSSLSRDNVAHGKSLRRQLSAAYSRARAIVAARRSLLSEPAPGIYKVDENEVQTASIFVPNEATEFLAERLEAVNAFAPC